jgi:zinc transporter ZupT
LSFNAKWILNLAFFHKPALSVFIFALIAAVATGLGAVPFFFIKKMSRKWLGISNALAAGLMLAASFDLIYEGLTYSYWMSIAGVLFGLILIIGSQRLISHYGAEVRFENLSGADVSKVLLILGIMTVHSFAEGVSIGVSFAGNLSLGLFITTALAIHNIPEGLAISLVMVPRGTSAIKAVWWSIFSSLPQPLMAVPAFLLVDVFHQYLPMGLGFAAGAMTWMVFAELIPDARKDASPAVVASVITLAIIFMLILQMFI